MISKATGFKILFYYYYYWFLAKCPYLFDVISSLFFLLKSLNRQRGWGEWLQWRWKWNVLRLLSAVRIKEMSYHCVLECLLYPWVTDTHAFPTADLRDCKWNLKFKSFLLDYAVPSSTACIVPSGKHLVQILYEGPIYAHSLKRACVSSNQRCCF